MRAAAGPRRCLPLWMPLWTVMWTVVWTALCAALCCGVAPASATGCPAVSGGGRVVCLQAQLCSPGRPLPGPGCGPRLSHVCCLKGGAEGEPQPGPVPAPQPGPPPPGPPQPWRPDQHQPRRPGQPEPWRPQPPEPWRPQPPKPWKPLPNQQGPWRPGHPNTLGPEPPFIWESDQTAPVFPDPSVVPSPPPLPSPLPPVKPLSPVPPSTEPQLQCGREQPVTSRRRGRRTPNGLLGVTGGQDAARQRWPWAALLGKRDTSGQRWFCGAVLVSHRALLTAAHCVTGMEPAQLLVRLGEYDLSTTSDGPTEDVTPAELRIHPGYTAERGRGRGRLHDLAVVRLRQPAALGPHVQPVCLPVGARPAGELTGQRVSLAGWGLTEFAGSQSDVLQEAELRVVSPGSCEDAYRQLPAFDTTFPAGFNGSVLCATGGGGELARDACSGDSGGPLVQRLSDGSYQLAGVVSAGVGCGNPEYPGLYTRVGAYTDWILQNI